MEEANGVPQNSWQGQVDASWWELLSVGWEPTWTLVRHDHHHHGVGKHYITVSKTTNMNSFILRKSTIYSDLAKKVTVRTNFTFCSFHSSLVTKSCPQQPFLFQLCFLLHHSKYHHISSPHTASLYDSPQIICTQTSGSSRSII